MIRRNMILVMATLLAAGLWLGLVTETYAEPLGPTPEIDRTGEGLSVAEAGVGLGGMLGGQNLPATLTVSIGGPVEQAVLYWSGNDGPTGEPGDRELTFGGEPVTGSLAGAEVLETTAQGEIEQFFAYRADVTANVQAAVSGPGSYDFVIDDADSADNADLLYGASLLVLYTDTSDSTFYRVLTFDGADYAFSDPRWADPDNNVTEPLDISYEPAASARTAELVVFGGGGEEGRPDHIAISDNADQNDVFDNDDGLQWDTDELVVTIPAGVDSTTVQAVSPSEPEDNDSFVWTLAALRFPVAEVPTAVDLAGQSAAATDDGVLVRWTTVNESDIVGFNLWRSLDGGERELIASLDAEVAGQPAGAEYSYVDTLWAPGSRYEYYLEVIRTGGGSETAFLTGLTPGAAPVELFLPFTRR